uniref:Uncharacterized protein n=1 Tax=Elaeophora elaphi TaxID=1147741 RepID=A0A0R3RH34_9BILA
MRTVKTAPFRRAVEEGNKNEEPGYRNDIKEKDTAKDEATKATEPGKPKDSVEPEKKKTTTVRATVNADKSGDSAGYDNLFTIEHLGLQIPVKSAVHSLNSNVLKEKLLKKLSEKLGELAEEDERKEKEG